MRSLFLLPAFILIFSGCSSEGTKVKEPVSTSFNNAEFDEWTGTYSTKKSDHAHSGNTVAFIDSSIVYSMSYSKLIENISRTKLDSVVFSYWAYCANNKINGQTVLSIDKADNSKNSYWTSFPVEAKLTETNKWIFIREVFKLPANLDVKNNLKLYVWNNSNKEILLDDFKVDFY